MRVCARVCVRACVFREAMFALADSLHEAGQWLELAGTPSANDMIFLETLVSSHRVVKESRKTWAKYHINVGYILAGVMREVVAWCGLRRSDL